MAACLSCGTAWPDGDAFCGQCGHGRGAPMFLLALSPAIATGLVVALIGIAIGAALPEPQADAEGFVSGILSFVLRTTVPYFYLGFGALSGWALVVALHDRSAGCAAAGGALLGGLYFVVLLMASGTRGVPSEVPLLLVAGSLCLLGALVAIATGKEGPLASKADRVVQAMPGGRYVGAGVAALLVAFAAVVAYGLLVTAVVITLALIGIYIALRIVGAMLDDGQTVTVHRSRSGGFIGRSIRRKAIVGDDYVDHYNADGDRIGRSVEREALLGDDYVQHLDADGNAVGRSVHREALLGDDYDQHYEADGEKAGKSVHREGMLGARYEEHYDADGERVGRTDHEEGIFGERRRVHRGEDEQ